MALINVGECIFDARLLQRSHGYESLDAVAREAFVNHLHLDGNDRVPEASRIIDSWIDEMRSRWPSRTFRIYRQTGESETTIRFHEVKENLPNWCEDGVEIITVVT